MRYPSLFLRLLANSVESELYAFEGSPCWEYTGHKVRWGYGRIAMRVPGKPNPQGIAVHRLMAELVVGRKLCPSNETIEHLCEITWCINPMHFGICTAVENVSDMHARRNGRPRKKFRRLVDPATHSIPYLVRALPVPHSLTCPF